MIRRLLDSPVPALAGLCLLLLADGAGLVRLSLLASLVHESGHILAYLLLLGRWPPLRLTLSGIGLRADGLPLSCRQESLLLAAGPLANFVCCGALALLIAFRASWGRYFFLAANLCVGCYNLLPFGALDGARLLALWCPPGHWLPKLAGGIGLAVAAAGLGFSVYAGGTPLWLGAAGALSLAALVRETFSTG